MSTRQIALVIGLAWLAWFVLCFVLFTRKLGVAP